MIYIWSSLLDKWHQKTRFYHLWPSRPHLLYPCTHRYLSDWPQWHLQNRSIILFKVWLYSLRLTEYWDTDWRFSLVLKCDATDLWKKRWRSKISQYISTKNNYPSLLVELSIGKISQKTNVIKDTSPAWNQTFPLWVWSFCLKYLELQQRITRLSSKSSETLSIMIHRDTSTSKSVTIGYGEITLNELLDGDGGKEGIDQYLIYNSFLVTKQ